ncbi:MAG: hypothetical protein LKI42_01550 [Bacteroidales bacterium]|jgi:hypothetical protein|nr:hypothetical protein [Bacteroidales bacterium]MCI1784960.1 hypothetical protein [Bacteroidales bacterium]
MRQLDKAIRQSGKSLDVQGGKIVCRYREAKDYYSPVNVVAMGLKNISSLIPFDAIALGIIRCLKAKLSKPADDIGDA